MLAKYFLYIITVKKWILTKDKVMNTYVMARAWSSGRSSGSIVTSDITSHAVFALHHIVLMLLAILLLVLVASFNE